MNREQINNLINTCQQEIRRLQEENQQLKEQLEASEKVRKDAIEYILKHKRNLIHAITHEKYEILDDENIVNLLNILDIDKGE